MTQVAYSPDEAIFNNFILGHVTFIKDYTNVPIEETDFVGNFHSYPLRLTHFDDIYDTLLYSKLIEKAISYNPGAKRVVDLGAGSSIPSLLAVKNSQRSNLKAVAVDIDPEAKLVGEYNAKVLGLSEDYEFVSSRMENVLEAITDPSTVVVSNPPYIPAPPSITDPHFVPINGGHDGTDYMLRLLNHSYPKDTIVAFLWGSLSNPSKLLPVIEERFEVLHVEAMKIHFGKYTTHPEIFEHLCKLREEGKVYFSDDKRQLVVGTILRAK